MPLGFYLSQWLSNVYLDDLDWFIESCNLKHVRYVDDIVLFGNNKRKIRKCFEGIKQLLGKDRLVVKNNYNLYRSYEPLSFLGFIFTKTQLRLRKNIARNILKVAKHINKAKENHRSIWVKDARTLLSYMGWIKHSDSYIFYLLNVKPLVIIKKLKRIVSHIERRIQNDKVDNGSIRPLTAFA